MKRICKTALGVVLSTVGMILGFVGDPSISAAALVQVSPVSLQPPTVSLGENAYCVNGDIWTGPTSDGPAQLPRACVYTGLDGSPSSGKVTFVPADGDVVGAVSASSCGDTIRLQRGATFTLKGTPQFPSKNCDARHWITIRTDAPDSDLPDEHVRVNPSYAGIPSLPGRPPFSGSSRNVMAKLVVPQNPITIGDHYRIVGMEITRPNDGKWYDALVALSAPHIILDRDWIHGDPLAETTHLVQIRDGADHVALINSYLNDAHCTAVTGACTDAQAFSDGGHGTVVKVYNNFLEASGQSILFGGASAVLITSDVEIRLNHMFKPLNWNPLDPKFIGTKFIVKNSFELKEGQRVLVEGNIMQNTWGGFTQKGANVLLTPKNQSGKNGRSICPICFVADVTLRYNYVLHGARALEVANGPNDNGGWSRGGHSYSIHDMVFDGMQYTECYECGLFLTELGSGYQSTNPPPSTEVIHAVLLNHITVVNSGWLGTSKSATGFMEMNGPPADNSTETPQISKFQFNNSIMDAGHNGAYPTQGGSDNCSVGQKAVDDKISACWAGASSLTGNLFITDNATTTLIFPSGNFTTSSWSDVGFVNFNGGDGGDYHLLDSSPYHNAGTDGKDLGADIDLVNAIITFAR